MNQAFRLCVLPVFVLLPTVSFGYKETTHIKLSEQAAKISVLGDTDGQALLNLGLKPSISGSSQVFPNSKNDPRPIIDLFTDGADFEDDTETVKRPLNHFFDPLRNQALRPYGIPLFNDTSPDWALEDLENFGSQAFSFRHARDYLYKALTLSDEQERKENFGLTFQTLGHVIHHLQDMAQPQHVRNDAHPDSPKEFFGIIPNPFYNESLYEKYTNDNRHQAFFTQHLAQGAYKGVDGVWRIDSM